MNAKDELKEVLYTAITNAKAGSRQLEVEAAKKALERLDNCHVIPKEDVKPWMLEQFQNYKDNEHCINRHNEDGVEELACLLGNAALLVEEE